MSERQSLKNEIVFVEAAAGRKVKSCCLSNQHQHKKLPVAVNVGSYEKPDLYSFESPLNTKIHSCQHRLDRCKTTWHFGLDTHDVTGAMEVVSIPEICGERNCPNCLENRMDRIKNSKFKILAKKHNEGISHHDLWSSFKPNMRVGHVVLTNPEIPREDMKTVLPLLRKNVNRFTRKLRGFNVWGYGVFEFKYNPATEKYRPHTHLITFGLIPDAALLQDAWTKINGRYQKAVVFYSPKRERNEPLARYYQRLLERKLKMLDYFARRSAGAGLITADIPDASGKLVETVIGSIPMEDYVEFVKGSRLYFSFGKRREYVYRGKKVKTNIPQGILQSWEQRNKEIEKNKGEITHIYLGTLSKSHFADIGGSPPPNSEHLRAILDVYDSFPDDISELLSESALFRLAFKRVWGIA